ICIYHISTYFCSMHIPNLISFGIITIIAGTLLIYKTGLPDNLKPYPYLLISEESEIEKRERLRYNAMIRFQSGLGMLFIITGLLMEFIAANASFFQYLFSY